MEQTLDSLSNPTPMDDETTPISVPKSLPDSNSESDSASESESDDEAVDNLELETLETELTNNPGNYDAHVQYIRALRKKGDIEKLRKAREAMSEIFPLTPAMWMEWTKDETTLSSGNNAFTAIEKLYERGVSDYMSVSLWCEFIKFVQEFDPVVREGSPAGILKSRNLFERALTAAGLHIAEGSKIWEAYRKFEQAILDSIDKDDVESRNKQVQRIRTIFHRQLSIPLGDLPSTLLTYKAWEAGEGLNLDTNSSSLDGIASHVSSAYQKALELLNSRVHLEEQVSRQETPDSERIQQYMAYLKLEQSHGDPARVQFLYERAITDFPISADIWLDYTRYLDRTLKVAKVVKDVYCRATKNCPWVGELWVRYLLCLERSHALEEDLSAVFEKSLNCTFSSFEEYLDLFLTRVDGLRRRISLGGEAIDFSVIRETFQRASDYLSPQLKNTDSLLQMHRYWSRLESCMGNDITAARGVWESFLKSSGSMMEAWQGYISMEIEAEHIREARSLYKRCYSKKFPGTGSEDICHLWIRFEREFGTLEDFDFAMQKVTPRLTEIQLFKLQQESASVFASVDHKEISGKRKEREKRKPVSDITEQSPAKRQKGSTQKLKKSDVVDKSQVEISVEPNKKEDAEIKASKTLGGNDGEAKDLIREKPKHFKDQCTAFMSNLSFEVTSEDINNFFSDVGGVVAVRILKDKHTKKSRGLAYVDFSDDAHLDAAVAKNKKNLLGKRVSIARSDPKGRKGGPEKRTNPREYGQSAFKGPSGGDDNVEIRGKNTFAIPRAVRPLGFTSISKPKSDESGEGGDEQPKSNDEFRKMLLKK